MKQILLVFVTLTVWGLSLHAQRYYDGNLVLETGDTLTGLVGFGPNETFVFREDMKTKAKYKKEFEVTGYQFDDDIYRKFYVEVQMGNFPEHRVVFLKAMVEGPVTLYEYHGKGLLFGEHTNHFLHHIDSEVPFRVPEGKRYFKAEMKNYFRDCEEVAEKIKSKEYGYDDLVEIVVKFNLWYEKEVAKDSEETVN